MSDHSDTSNTAMAPGDAPGATSRSSRPRSAPLVRSLGLAFVLALASTAIFVTHLRPIAASGGQLPWWLLAIGFGLAEILVFHIEVRREAVSFSLSEIPLTLALFFASPVGLIAGRLIGESMLLILHERQQPRKIVINLAVFFTECVTAVTVFHALSGSHVPSHPATWAAAAVAVATADAVGLAVVITVMRWHGAPVEPARMAATNAVTAVTNIGLAILAAVLLDTNPWAAGLLVFLTVVIVLAYRAYSALSRRYASLELLYEFTRIVSGSKHPELVLASMLKEARRLLRADAAAIVTIIDGDLLSLWLGPDDDIARPRVLPFDTLSRCVEAGQSVVIARNERDGTLRAVLDTLGVADCVLAPLNDAAETIGVLLVANRETAVSTFDAEDGRIFETLANHAGMALENGRLIVRLHEQARQREHEAFHDSLTELPNRASFLAHLTASIDAASNGGQTVGVAILDLDHFKEVNDTLGHHHGDLLLAEVASRLATSLPASVTLARLGGDEFALLIRHPTSRVELMKLGQGIQTSFQHPFWVEGLGLEVGVSIGFALYPDHGTDPSTLMQRADVAMYDAKASTTNRIEVYDSERDSNSPRRLALATDLRVAIETGGLTLHYQPKARLADGTIHGVEALVRWHHPTYGNVPPDDFVPLAERTGLIQPFTDFVVNHGIQQLRIWTQRGLDLSISLNLSTRNLLDPTLPTRIHEVLTTSGVQPAKITFEVTESSVMAEPDKALKVLHCLADLGVRLSIDDFGTGHSSLAYLQRLPVHEVKIDKSFIWPLATDPSARAIVQSIIRLAHNLELNVVAEGIEDRATWELLDALGCDDAQGHYLCCPIPTADLDGWLVDRVNERSHHAGLGNTPAATRPGVHQVA